MMTAFIVLCALMALAAMSVLAFPLLRPLPATAKGEPVVPKAAPLAFALSVAVGIAATLLYYNITSFPWNDPTAAQPVPAGHGSMNDSASMEEVVGKLEARLQKAPNDREGWRMLGRTYLITGRPAKAAEAYERAAALSSEKDPALALDLAEALVLGDDPAQQPRAKEIIDETLAADANNQKALWYRGVMAMRGGDTATARKSWTQLLDQNPPQEIREVIASQLADLGVAVPGAAPAAATPAVAQSAGGMSGPMSGGTNVGAEAAAKGRTIHVSVKVDPAIADKVKPGVPLFVSARQPGIPGPPLAAVRLVSDELPASVTLSDANAMIQGRDLSSVDDVEIVARVAFSGSVMSSSGDLVGTAVQKKGGSDQLEVVIAKVQP